jgi:hypothetical protein
MEEDSEMYYENENKKKLKKKMNSSSSIPENEKNDELNIEIASESIESNSLIQRLLSTLIDENNIKSSSAGYSARKRTKLKKVEEELEEFENEDISISTNDYTPQALKFFEDKMWNELRNLGISTSMIQEKKKETFIENDEISNEIKLLQERLKEQHSRNEEKKLKIFKIAKDSIQQERKIQKKYQEYKQFDKEYKQLIRRKKL